MSLRVRVVLYKLERPQFKPLYKHFFQLTGCGPTHGLRAGSIPDRFKFFCSAFTSNILQRNVYRGCGAWLLVWNPPLVVLPSFANWRNLISPKSIWKKFPDNEIDFRLGPETQFEKNLPCRVANRYCPPRSKCNFR